MGYIAGIGGANVDIHGQSLAPIIMRDSNPGKLHTSMGGVVRNVLENCARLGLKPSWPALWGMTITALCFAAAVKGWASAPTACLHARARTAAVISALWTAQAICWWP